MMIWKAHLNLYSSKYGTYSSFQLQMENAPPEICGVAIAFSVNKKYNNSALYIVVKYWVG